MHAVVLPILDANMTHGVVRAWRKREGDAVAAGEPLFEVETDKVNAEVEAETAGILRRVVAAVGTRVAVLSVVAFIGAADETVPELEGGQPSMPSEAAPAASPQLDAAARVAASPAARRLARERGLALDNIRPSGPRGEITRADVEAVSQTRAAIGEGAVDPDFLDRMRHDPESFRTLCSDMKVDLYRRHGARVGDGVRFEAGALVIAAQMCIGAGSTIGEASSIECARLHLGRLVAFGKRTRVRCQSVEIGDALWSKDDVVIGGGGSDEPGACLRAGDACFFGEAAYLNTGHPLTLGDEVCIGSRAMLFTHSHWQSVLRGYASLFGPISVGDHVFIGNNAFVFPGVTVGAGATVMVNSFVAVNVPANAFVGGVPAHVLRHTTPPTRAEQIGIVRERFLPELAATLASRGYSVARHDAGEVTTFDLGDGGIVRFIPAWASADAPAAGRREIVLTFVGAEPVDVPNGRTLFDLAGARVCGVQDELSDEVRELCRRRGVRFRPFAWRYRVGHFDGDRFYARRV